jgi:lipoic acid synthetase
MCPNIADCFSRSFATFLILGRNCTRSCGYCSSGKGAPQDPNPSEAGRIAEAVRRLRLKYAIITSVTRDDLEDGGAATFSTAVKALKASSSGIAVEILVPDFCGNEESIETVAMSGADVVGHNIETVRRLYRVARPEADYDRSLKLLRLLKRYNQRLITKSGIMAGLGESRDEMIAVMEDLRIVGCDMLTIGQYLRPSQAALPVERFLEPGEFDEYARVGRELGFKDVASGPFVRSSYFAKDSYRRLEGLYERRDFAAVGGGRRQGERLLLA